MKYLKSTLGIALIFAVAVACEVNTEKFPSNPDELHSPENTGGFLRTSILQGGAFDLQNLGTQSFVVVLEADDAMDGDMLESVDFYVAFTDNAADEIGDIDETADPILTVDGSEFTEDPDTGLPRDTISVDAQTIVSALGLQISDFDLNKVNSSFDLRWELHLTNGKTFTTENSGSNVTGGAFFSSPFSQRIFNVIAIPEDQFVGTYTMTQVAPNTSGPSGVFANGYVFDDDGDGTITIDISVDPDNTLNGRIFDAAYLASLGFGPGTYRFSLTRDPVSQENIVIWPNQSTGLGCSQVILLGRSNNRGNWDPNDDTTFSIILIDDITNDCGTGSPETTFNLVKQ